MTHSGFKTAQKKLNLIKKENNNKDYRAKQDIFRYVFSSRSISFDYILRIKHGICLNEKNKNYLLYHYLWDQANNPSLITFEEHTDDENKIIQEELQLYFTGVSNYTCSVDKTHSKHSKNLTKNKNNARKYKLEISEQ
jgi:hypothetical protein